MDLYDGGIRFFEHDTQSGTENHALLDRAGEEEFVAEVQNNGIQH
jgi:hypothetical protein